MCEVPAAWVDHRGMDWPTAAVIITAIVAAMVVITTYLGTRKG